MSIFPYSWHHYEEYGQTKIRVFGLSEKNQSIYLQIDDFLPYIYVELPSSLNYTLTSFSVIQNKLKEISFNSIIKSEPVKRKKLYFAKKDKIENEYVDKMYPFIKCFFKTTTNIRNFVYKLKAPLFFGGVGKIQLKCHEMDASPILQFMCIMDIKPASWFLFKGQKITKEDEKEGLCDHEFNVSYLHVKPNPESISKAPARPYILSFDIEVNSINPNIAPRSEQPGDKIFQISCVFGRNGDKEETYERIILTLCKNKKGEIIELNLDKLGEGIEVLGYETESDLLEGFKDLVLEKNPQIICGYNIFSFDLPYMYERSKICNVERQFCQLSCIRGMSCKTKEIKWSSSAFKNQSFKYLDAHGRLWVDMLPIIQRDYKLENYKLKTVSDNFLGQSKDPLTVKGIFKCYRIFTGDSLAIVGKYCVKDSELVLKLFEKLQIWIGLCEMSNTCNTPIFTLFTQGQQIKIFSQVYKKCMYDGIVIDKDSFTTKESDKFTGAYVFTPIPGLYEMVVSFDFSSLYPSTIIAYNIDYSTLVLDEKIPDNLCHVIEWEEHIGCGHDQVVHKTKVKEIVCEKQRFRFLKEPAGVIPTLLKNLLDARKKTNKEMKLLKSELEEMKDKSSLEYDEKKRMITVLDKRQLSFKVSANSMYGGMGTRVGYLPFLPGAMCTTAKGRQSIEKASKFLIENYGAKLIYGDSVSGDTPILVRYEDQTVDILRIDEIGEVWKSYEEFKNDEIDSNRKEKEQTLPFVSNGSFRLMNILEVWTGDEWSRIKRVIRHKTIKKMYRVLTHTGCVDVTEDHSLLDIQKNKIKPSELSIGTELYHSFPPKEDFLEIEIKDAMIEGKVYKCYTCHEYKLEFEFNNSDICKECKNKKNKNPYFSETEYIRNPSKNLCEELAFVWGMFFAEGSLDENIFKINDYYKNSELLEKCKLILEKYEPLFNWKIEENTLFTNSYNKLFIMNKWRHLFYDKKGNKKVPYFILNASDNIKYNFFMGFYLGGRFFTKSFNYIFHVKGKIAAHGLYTLLYSLGFNISIDVYSHNNSFILKINENTKINENIVKKIINLKDTSDDQFVYDIETESGRFLGGVGKIILKNTDSCYINFPEYMTIEKAKDLDSFCRQVEDEVSCLFPKPMKLAYEENIYWRYLILTKKRYMALKCDLDGNINEKIEKRGVLLSRRDNSKYIRDTYSTVIMKSFYKEDINTLIYKLLEDVKKICINNLSIKELSITKGIGEVGDYKIRALPIDDKKCIKRLQELGIYDKDICLLKLRDIFLKKDDLDDIDHSSIEYLIYKEYIKMSLPAQVQLAERMRSRGSRVDAGERLGYIITQNGDKLSTKMEDIDYFKEHSKSLKIDYLYYIKLMINPFDEVLMAVYGKKDIFKTFYKTREKYKKVIDQLEELFRPKIIFN